MIQAGWWTQEVANKAGIAEHPCCLKCGPAVRGLAQHQGVSSDSSAKEQTATRDKLKWERGLMHDPVEKYTPGRTHDGTIHVWNTRVLSATVLEASCLLMDP